MKRALIFKNLSFSHDAASKPLFQELQAHFPPGWTGVVGPNGCGKTTLLKLATGLLRPQAGGINAPGVEVLPGEGPSGQESSKKSSSRKRPSRQGSSEQGPTGQGLTGKKSPAQESSAGALYCPQRTDHLPEELEEFLTAPEGQARRLQGQLGIGKDWPARWETLSHGERKRAQIAIALWLEPQVLALDEPTNHLDGQARKLLSSVLPAYRGIGILVSHDRQLLDDLCRQCLFIDPPSAVMRPGSYTQAAAQARRERESRRGQYQQAQKELTRLKREAARRREIASRADRMRSKRGLAHHDSDGRAKINLIRVSGADGKPGRLFKQMAGRLQQAREKGEALRMPKQTKMIFWLPGSRAKRDTLFTLSPGVLALDSRRKLTYPELIMRPRDRIALTGPNGGGKSSLIRLILASQNLPREAVVYLPQEIDLNRARRILEEARALPPEALGHVMTVVSGLGSRPEPLLESSEPSPGETRKLLLALGVARRPYLIVMDEPTNHLDLPSMELLEKALSDCPCGLLLVSHDRRFLETTTEEVWSIVARGADELVLDRKQ